MEIKKLHDAIDFLRQEVGNVTLLQLEILLSVMVADPDEVTQPELITRYRSTGATISRNTNLFRDREEQNRDGKWVHVPGYLVFKDDPEDSRKLVISLNDRGTQLKMRISNFR